MDQCAYMVVEDLQEMVHFKFSGSSLVQCRKCYNGHEKQLLLLYLTLMLFCTMSNKMIEDPYHCVPCTPDIN